MARLHSFFIVFTPEQTYENYIFSLGTGTMPIDVLRINEKHHRKDFFMLENLLKKTF